MTECNKFLSTAWQVKCRKCPRSMRCKAGASLAVHTGIMPLNKTNLDLNKRKVAELRSLKKHLIEKWGFVLHDSLDPCYDNLAWCNWRAINSRGQRWSTVKWCNWMAVMVHVAKIMMTTRCNLVKVDVTANWKLKNVSGKNIIWSANHH